MDRMENKGPDKGEDPNIGLTAQLKAQKASAERLCTTKSVPTLPDGVTLRDDSMTRTIAFIQAVPKLQ